MVLYSEGVLEPDRGVLRYSVRRNLICDSSVSKPGGMGAVEVVEGLPAAVVLQSNKQTATP